MRGERGADLDGAEEGPVAISLAALHEEVGHPERVEQVARPVLLRPCLEIRGLTK